MTSTLPPLVQAISASAGSAAAKVLTYPLDLITTRVQLEHPRKHQRRGGVCSIFLTSEHIITRHGWRALYDGLSSDTCATALSNLLYFYVYSAFRSLSTENRLKPSHKASKPHRPSMIGELVLGFVAGLVSRAATSPLSIITLKVQTRREEAEERGSGAKEIRLRETIQSIYREHGLKGFWKGFQTTALLCLNPSLTMMCFQAFRRILGALRAGDLKIWTSSPKLNMISSGPSNTNPGPWEAFLGAAISSTIATAILYPLILIKVRLQATEASSIGEVISDAYQGKDDRLTVSESSLSSTQETPTTASKLAAVPQPGIPGLYQGLESQILKGFLNQGVTFLVKGRIEQLIVAAYLARQRKR